VPGGEPAAAGRRFCVGFEELKVFLHRSEEPVLA
jgi:hypothetical protein